MRGGIYKSEDAPQFIYCPSCGGNGYYLGAMGAGTAYRCRDCGMIHTMPVREALEYAQLECLED